MLTVTKTGNWKLYWGTMPLPDGAQALGVVSRDDGTGALILLASGQYVQGNAGGIRTLPQREVGEALAVSNAAAALGRKGGTSTSEAKTSASRENGKRGGRPRKPSPDLLPIGSRVTLNAKRSTRLNGRTATITAVEKSGRQYYYRVDNIDGMPPLSSQLYKIGDVIPQ